MTTYLINILKAAFLTIALSSILPALESRVYLVRMLDESLQSQIAVFEFLSKEAAKGQENAPVVDHANQTAITLLNVLASCKEIRRQVTDKEDLEYLDKTEAIIEAALVNSEANGALSRVIRVLSESKVEIQDSDELKIFIGAIDAQMAEAKRIIAECAKQKR